MNILKTKNNYTYIILLLSFFISEAIYKLLIDFDLKEVRIAGIVKFIIQLYMLYVIIKDREKHVKEIILISIVVITYVIGQLVLPDNSNLIKNIEYLNNALFIIITLLFFKSVNLSIPDKIKALQYYEGIVIVNSIAIFVGYIGTIKYFKTYEWLRFGYDGFLIKSSYASYFYLMAVFYFSQKLVNKKRRDIFLFIIVVLAAILTGTKAALLSVGLVMLYLFFELRLYKNKVVISILSFSVLSLLLLIKTITNWFMEYSTTFGPVIKEKGVFTALFSYRDLILTESLIPFIKENWSIWNYLFGGMGEILYKCGFDVLDIIYFFGIIGGIVYVCLLYRVFLPTHKKKDIWFFIAMIIVVSSLGGNFFYNSSLAIFLCAIKFNFELKYE